ncbi:hypothetical protein B0I08_11174 [Glaciihabitans tibetensis]|uniref:Uncharacterized protein n=1 Tax=Glaciihabitans tibetensis TaxID=1266600 RepID=A0A2T0V4E5_9MICO|nr:hypothetical protein [Glaciihabitans tibetensis]PRY65056.1 hypothetical protein B0I08_11174 [Glaciihabitans tibetensis]
MTFQDDEPELAGYEPTDGRTRRGHRNPWLLRVVVLLGLVGLVLPGILTTMAVGNTTAQRACEIWVAYMAPDSPSSQARFEVFGPGTIGWECYTEGTFGGDAHVASLGLIPGTPNIPRVGIDDGVSES